jgi:hypothetical protein
LHSLSESKFDEQVYIPATISITTTMLGGGIVFSPKSDQHFNHNLCTPHRITTFEYGISYYRPRQTIPAHNFENPMVYSNVMLSHKSMWKSMSLSVCTFQSEIRKSIITYALPVGWRRLSIDYYTTGCDRDIYAIISK